jgi:hypothetical protein
MVYPDAEYVFSLWIFFFGITICVLHHICFGPVSAWCLDICTHTRTYTHKHTYIHTFMNTYAHTYTYIHRYIHIYIHVYIYCVCLCVCARVCVYIPIYILSSVSGSGSRCVCTACKCTLVDSEDPELDSFSLFFSPLS